MSKGALANNYNWNKIQSKLISPSMGFKSPK